MNPERDLMRFEHAGKLETGEEVYTARAAIPHAYTTSVTAYKKHHTQGAATAAYVLRYVIFPKNSTIYHEHTKYIRLRTLVIPRGLMKRGELLLPECTPSV